MPGRHAALPRSLAVEALVVRMAAATRGSAEPSNANGILLGMDRNRGVGTYNRTGRRRALIVAGSMVAGLLAAACTGSQAGVGSRAVSSGPNGGSDFSARFAAFEAADEPNADPSKVVWPAWMTRAGPEVRRLYEFHLVNGELMRYMPCFCGCQNEDGHRNNRDCYIDTVNADGSVVFDSMAPT